MLLLTLDNALKFTESAIPNKAYDLPETRQVKAMPVDRNICVSIFHWQLSNIPISVV